MTCERSRTLQMLTAAVIGLAAASAQAQFDIGPSVEYGDMNCDGALDGADIDPFFLALGDPAAYAAQFPECSTKNGDVNGDGSLDGADIDPFFQCLGGNCP